MRVDDVAGSMTKCVKPLTFVALHLSDLATLSAKSSRSTNQNYPFGTWTTQHSKLPGRYLRKWFDALCHICRALVLGKWKDARNHMSNVCKRDTKTYGRAVQVE